MSRPRRFKRRRAHAAALNAKVRPLILRAWRLLLPFTPEFVASVRPGMRAIGNCSLNVYRRAFLNGSLNLPFPYDLMATRGLGGWRFDLDSSEPRVRPSSLMPRGWEPKLPAWHPDLREHLDA